jgi:hypothetical protein
MMVESLRPLGVGSSAHKDKIRDKLRFEGPADLDILPSAEVCGKIVNNPLCYPFSTDSSPTMWTNLIKWLIVMTTIVETDPVTPLAFLLRISEHGPLILPKITQILSGQSLPNIWKLLINPPSSVYRQDTKSLGCMPAETAKSARSTEQKVFPVEKKLRVDNKSDIACHKMAKFGNCLGTASGHSSCPFNHSKIKLEKYRAEKGFPDPIDKPKLSE